MFQNPVVDFLRESELQDGGARRFAMLLHTRLQVPHRFFAARRLAERIEKFMHLRMIPMPPSKGFQGVIRKQGPGHDLLPVLAFDVVFQRPYAVRIQLVRGALWACDHIAEHLVRVLLIDHRAACGYRITVGGNFSLL